MCTTDLCNANDFNFHTERANQLFGLNSAVESQQSAAASKKPVTIITPSPIDKADNTEELDVTKILDRDQERTETLWTENSVDLVGDETVETPRSPRQTQGNLERTYLRLF